MLVQIAEAGFLPAAKGVIGQRNRDWHVDPDHADIHARREVARGIAIAGKDRGAVAIFMVHRHFQRFFIGLGADSRQDRTKDLFAIDLHVGGDMVKEMRADKIAVLIALQVEVPPIDHQLCTLRHAGFHQLEDIGLGRSGDDRAVINVIARGVRADFQLFDPRDQFRDQRIGCRFAHRDRDGDCHATLAGRTVARADQSVSRLVQIGIGHDDHVVLCTAEALHALPVGAAAPIDIFRDRGGAHKANGLNGFIVQNRINRFLVAVDDLKHAIRQTGFLEQLGQHQRHARVALGGLEDEGVAAGKGRAHFPQRDHRGEVERGDARRHAQRLAHRIHVDAGACAVGELALQHLGGPDAIFDHFQPALNVAFGIRNGLTMLAAQGLGQLVHVLVDQADHGHHHPAALLRVGGGPGDLCGGGIGHGGIQLCLAGQRYLRLHFTRCGVIDIGETPRCAFDMFAVDPMGQFLHSALQLFNWPHHSLAKMCLKGAISQKRFAFLQSRRRLEWIGMTCAFFWRWRGPKACRGLERLCGWTRPRSGAGFNGLRSPCRRASLPNRRKATR